MKRFWIKWTFLSISLLLFGFFIYTTVETQESTFNKQELIGKLDHFFVSNSSSYRTPFLTVVFLHLTDLASSIFISCMIFLTSAFFILKKRYLSAAHLILAGVGAGLFTFFLKSYFVRQRPDAIHWITEVKDYSYPSGHSVSASAVYFTLAFILSDALNSKFQKTFLFLFFTAFVLTIGFSRIYLGVHYFSDVFAGIILGFAWASLLQGLKKIKSQS